MKYDNSKIRDAYNKAAVVYKEKYQKIGVRKKDIDTAFLEINKSQPRILEVGCAYGREATYILTKTPHYVGIDISKEFISIAKTEVPTGVFEVADICEYTFKQKYDGVFAYASLLHLDKIALKFVLQNIHTALNSDGIVVLSLKRRGVCSSEIVFDGETERKFYYYTRDTILELCDGLYLESQYDEQVLDEPWFTIILKKI